MPTTISAMLTERPARLPIATSGQVPSAAPLRRTSCSSSMTTRVCVMCCRIQSRFSSLHHSFRQQRSPILTPPAKALKCPSIRTPSVYTTVRMAFHAPCQSPQLPIHLSDAEILAPEREIPFLQELPPNSPVPPVWLLRALRPFTPSPITSTNTTQCPS